MIKIKLMMNDEEKTFTVPFATTRAFRTFLDLQARGVLNFQTGEDMDEVVGFICDVFKNQFTIDEFYDGLSTIDFIPTIEKVIQSISGGDNADHPAKKGK